MRSEAGNEPEEIRKLTDDILHPVSQFSRVEIDEGDYDFEGIMIETQDLDGIIVLTIKVGDIQENVSPKPYKYLYEHDHIDSK